MSCFKVTHAKLGRMCGHFNNQCQYSASFQSHTCGLPFPNLLAQKTDRVCFPSRTHILGLHGLLALMFVLTFSYFWDVSFKEIGWVLSAMCIKMDCREILPCGQRAWNLEDRVSRLWQALRALEATPPSIRGQSSFLGVESCSTAKVVQVEDTIRVIQHSRGDRVSLSCQLMVDNPRLRNLWNSRLIDDNVWLTCKFVDFTQDIKGLGMSQLTKPHCPCWTGMRRGCIS
jgi:hypothetical protein